MKTSAHQETLPTRPFKRFLSKQAWQSYWLKLCSSCTNLSKISRETVNLQKTGPWETRSLKSSNAPISFSKRLQLEMKTTEFTSRDGSTFSSSTPITSTDPTFRNVWFVFCRTTQGRLRLPLPRTKSFNSSIRSLKRQGAKPFWQQNTWDFSQLSSSAKIEWSKKTNKSFWIVSSRTTKTNGVLSSSSKKGKKIKFTIRWACQQHIQYTTKSSNTDYKSH